MENTASLATAEDRAPRSNTKKENFNFSIAKMLLAIVAAFALTYALISVEVYSTGYSAINEPYSR